MHGIEGAGGPIVVTTPEGKSQRKILMNVHQHLVA